MRHTALPMTRHESPLLGNTKLDSQLAARSATAKTLAADSLTEQATSSPCPTCERRARCTTPCRELEALLEPEYRGSFEEIHSEALERGYLRAGAVRRHVN